MKHVIFSMGGKGGVGKTLVIEGLAEFLLEKGISFAMLDCDTENKERGSLASYFPEAQKVNIRQRNGLDAFIGAIEMSQLVLADLGAGSGFDTIAWFDEMYDGLREELGVIFTAIGVINHSPSSLETVFSWGAALQRRVSYLVVKNQQVEREFPLWDTGRIAAEFKMAFAPVAITLMKRDPGLQTKLENHKLTIKAALERKSQAIDTADRIRLRRIKTQMFEEFEKAMDILLPIQREG